MKKSQKVLSAIQSAAIFRCTDKITGKCLGYGVKSDSSEATYYVTARKVAGEWKYFCTCPARCENCKHVRAVLEVVEARKEFHQEAAPVASLAGYDVHAAAVEVVASVENAASSAAYAERAAQMTARRPVACDECFERGHWQEQGGKHLCPECVKEAARKYATCCYCGGNHASSTCYL